MPGKLKSESLALVSFVVEEQQTSSQSILQIAACNVTAARDWILLVHTFHHTGLMSAQRLYLHDSPANRPSRYTHHTLSVRALTGTIIGLASYAWRLLTRVHHSYDRTGDCIQMHAQSFAPRLIRPPTHDSRLILHIIYLRTTTIPTAHTSVHNNNASRQATMSPQQPTRKLG
jgi:hypothetical protein